jgi:hypothetical protein
VVLASAAYQLTAWKRRACGVAAIRYSEPQAPQSAAEIIPLATRGAT